MSTRQKILCFMAIVCMFAASPQASGESLDIASGEEFPIGTSLYFMRDSRGNRWERTYTDDEVFMELKEAGYNTIWHISDVPSWASWEQCFDPSWKVNSRRLDRLGLTIFPEFQSFCTEKLIDIKGGKVYMGCFNSEKNVKAAINICTKFVERYAKEGGGLFKYRGKYYMMLIDEAGMHGASPDKFQCYCENCRKAFPKWLKDVVYHDESPGEDTNGDGKTFNSDSGENFAKWEDVPLPKPEEMKERPYLWYRFVDFREWSIANFMARVQEALKPYNTALSVMSQGFCASPNMGPLMAQGNYYFFQAVPLPLYEASMPDNPIPSVGLCELDQLTSWIKKPYLQIIHLYRITNIEGSGDSCLKVGLTNYDRNYIARAYALPLMHKVAGQMFFDYHHYERRGLNFDNSELLKEVAWWQNFSLAHFKGYFKDAKVLPADIAVLFPWTAGIYYPTFHGPQKFDYIWGAKGLLEAHYPIRCIHEREIMNRDSLKDFKALYVFSADRLPKKVTEKIKEFHKNGGWVFADTNSLTMDIRGKKDDALFRSLFGAVLGDEIEAKEIKFSDKGIGIKDFKIHPKAEAIPRGKVYSAQAEGGKVLATANGKPVVISGDRALWTGVPVGIEMFTICPARYVPTEPATLPGVRHFSCRDYPDLRKLITYVADKSGAKKRCSVMQDGKIAPNIETGVTENPRTRVRLAVLMNHEPYGGEYEVKVELPKARGNIVALDLIHNRVIEEKTDGRFKVEIPGEHVCLIAVGPAKSIQKMSKIQKTFLEEMERRGFQRRD